MDGVTQWRIQEMYVVRWKQLAAYIMGHKYLGRMDRKVLTQKCKGSGNGDEPSTSK